MTDQGHDFPFPRELANTLEGVVTAEARALAQDLMRGAIETPGVRGASRDAELDVLAARCVGIAPEMVAQVADLCAQAPPGS